MAEDFKVNSNTDILEFKRKFNLFVSNYDKGEFDGDFEITGDLDVGGDVEITGDLEIKGELVGAETQIANAVSTYIGSHPFAPEMLENQDVDCKSLTADEILEKMSGYSYTAPTGVTNMTVEVIYASAVKTGNKLTFVIAMNLTRSGAVADNQNMGYFTIPSTIGAKLYPSLIGTVEYLDVRKIEAAKTGWQMTSLDVFSRKHSGTLISMNLSTSGLNNLDVDTKYYCRYELTFLLSDNMYTPGE